MQVYFFNFKSVFVICFCVQCCKVQLATLLKEGKNMFCSIACLWLCQLNQRESEQNINNMMAWATSFLTRLSFTNIILCLSAPPHYLEQRRPVFILFRNWVIISGGRKIGNLSGGEAGVGRILVPGQGKVIRIFLEILSVFHPLIGKDISFSYWNFTLIKSKLRSKIQKMIYTDTQRGRRRRTRDLDGDCRNALIRTNNCFLSC